MQDCTWREKEEDYTVAARRQQPTLSGFRKHSHLRGTVVLLLLLWPAVSEKRRERAGHGNVDWLSAEVSLPSYPTMVLIQCMVTSRTKLAKAVREGKGISGAAR